MNLLVLVGSTRPGSLNAQLADAALRDLPAHVTVNRFDRMHELPFYEEHIDAAGEFPAIVAEFREQVRAADAVLVVTPEYNGAMSGLLKNAIDIASRPRANSPLGGKPAAVLAATISPYDAAGARATTIEALRRAQAAPFETSIGVANAHDAFVDGDFNDAELGRRARALVAQLLDAPVPAPAA